ncbi:MAG: thiamine pyrophosphate-binding protein [Kofleriaceae bacterium]|nr:thiamine pyrophosphate-binding protein [Kofleriaceae bacterium]MBP6841815.1 thiamine pyrophosphate-binding protein [Kofleriaceae bacterium]
MPDPTPLIHQILEQLEREGVTHIFGVPGGPLTPFFGALRARDRIRYVLARHEEGAAFMANSFARVRRELAVCCVTSGPGATNALTGVAGAAADSLPVLYLTGQVATRMFGLGAIQESTSHGVDVVDILRPVTKLSEMIVSADTGMRLLRHALRLATTGRPGPVHLNVPADIARVTVPHDVRTPDSYRPRLLSVPGPDLVRQAATLLGQARRPVIFAGHGVALAGAERALLRLAERLQAPVVTSPKGKSVFPEQHPLSLGVFGMGGHARADRYLDGDDTILVVGSSLNEFASSAWSKRLGTHGAFLQVDIDPGELGKNYPVTLGLAGDARATLDALHDALDAGADAGAPRPDTAAALAAIAAEVPRHEQAEQLASETSPLAPPRVVAELRAALADDAMLFVDTGNSSLWAGHYFEARAPGSYFIDMGIAAMGSAVAGVVGGALAAPGRQAVALTGDAAFAMHGFEVHAAVELGLRVVWVVLDNAGHGMIQQGERLAFGADHGFYGFAHRIDAAMVARGLGARGVEVDTVAGLRAALAQALAADGPTVINVRVDPSIVAPTLGRRARAVAEFFGNVGVPAGPAGAG